MFKRIIRVLVLLLKPADDAPVWVVPLIITPMLSILMWCTADVIGRHLHDSDYKYIVGFLMVLYAVLLVGNIWSLNVYVTVSLDRRSFTRKERVGIVASAYIASIAVFAVIYFSIVAYSDAEECEATWKYYRNLNSSEANPKPERIESLRAFRGIEAKLWHGIDDDLGGKTVEVKVDGERVEHKIPKWPSESGPLPLEHRIALASASPVSESRRYAPENKWSVTLDCLHFSVATLTTLGYGDISPKSQLAKITSDVQALYGVILLALSLNLILSESPQEKDAANS